MRWKLRELDDVFANEQGAGMGPQLWEVMNTQWAWKNGMDKEQGWKTCWDSVI